MRGLIQDQSKIHPKKRRLASGIGECLLHRCKFHCCITLNVINENGFVYITEVRYPGSLVLQKEHGVQYLTFPWNNGKSSGYMRMQPGNEKAKRKSISTIVSFETQK